MTPLAEKWLVKVRACALALWCAATLDAQQLLVNAEPKHFFVPAYVGRLGWVGVRLDRGITWRKVKAIIEQAWRVRAPRKLEKKS